MRVCENGICRDMTEEEINANKNINPYEGYTYEELVGMFIREKYSANDEFAILRQKDTKPEEYETYDAYCEKCKARAKAIIRGDTNGNI